MYCDGNPVMYSDPTGLNPQYNNGYNPQSYLDYIRDYVAGQGYTPPEKIPNPFDDGAEKINPPSVYKPNPIDGGIKEINPPKIYDPNPTSLTVTISTGDLNLKFKYGFAVYLCTRNFPGGYGFLHSFIAIFAFENTELYNNSLFSSNSKNADNIKGLRYMTIGGGPMDGRKKDEFLSMYFQSEGDILSNMFHMVRLDLSMNQIYKIFERAKYFNDNSKGILNYGHALWTYYNCNSFTNGLLKASGINNNTLSDILVGWDNPVPKKFFGA